MTRAVSTVKIRPHEAEEKRTDHGKRIAEENAKCKEKDLVIL
jgi:hypothetical protein